jgi:hypothetical protein
MALLKHMMRSLRAFLVLSLFLRLATGSTLSSSTMKRVLTLEEVARVWVGVTEDEAYLLRLSLSPGGIGQAGYVYADSEPKVARITSWSYHSPTIVITIAKGLDFETLEGPDSKDVDDAGRVCDVEFSPD